LKIESQGNPALEILFSGQLTQSRDSRAGETPPLKGNRRMQAFHALVTMKYPERRASLPWGTLVLATAVFPRQRAHDFLKRLGEGARGFVTKGLRDFGMDSLVFAILCPANSIRQRVRYSIATLQPSL
jgi:hypothetical protein